MYTLTVFTLLALVVAIFFAVVVPVLRKQMRAMPGPQQRPSDWRREPLPPPREPEALNPRDPDRPMQP